jgi:hypothetical protein
VNTSGWSLSKATTTKKTGLWPREWVNTEGNNSQPFILVVKPNRAGNRNRVHQLFSRTRVKAYSRLAYSRTRVLAYFFHPDPCRRMAKNHVSRPCAKRLVRNCPELQGYPRRTHLRPNCDLYEKLSCLAYQVTRTVLAYSRAYFSPPSSLPRRPGHSIPRMGPRQTPHDGGRRFKIVSPLFLFVMLQLQYSRIVIIFFFFYKFPVLTAFLKLCTSLDVLAIDVLPPSIPVPPTIGIAQPRCNAGSLSNRSVPCDTR